MPNKILTFAETIDWTLNQIYKKDKSVFLMGLGANDPKHIFGTTKSISKNYSNRVFDMPISENSITGIVIGSSLNGLKPILVHQRIDFALLSFEQIINQAAKWYYMFDGKKNVPIVIRMIIGRGWGQGPQHSQSLHSLFSHIPGLKIVMPSTCESASRLLYSSIIDPNPVIFIEHRWLHNIKFNFKDSLKKTNLGKSKILNKGKDLTVISCSYMTIEMLRLIKYLKKENIGIDLIDLQIISPVDKATIINSVKKTKKVLILDVSHKSFGISSEIYSIICENCFNLLEKAPVRIANPDIPTPTSFHLAKSFYPNKITILKKIYKILDVKKNIDKAFFSIDKYQDQPFKDFTGPF